MVDSKFTRCPGCKTVFRVTPAQLALRNGQVRCGHCRAVFDANAQAISLAPQARAAFDADQDDLARGPATVTLRSSHALTPVAPERTSAAPAAPLVPPAAREPSFEPAQRDATPASVEAPKADDEAAPVEAPRRPATWPSAIAIPLLVVLLAAQALYHFRDTIAARWPAAKPLLARACEPLGCTIRPLREIAGLSIDASDLQADPAHKGLLILTATLRNRAATTLGYPYLELTLTDAQDRVVARRALAPGDYAGGTVNVGAGFPANSELIVKTFVDASATTQAGYRLYLFYP